jgi:hypothetical protein
MHRDLNMETTPFAFPFRVHANMAPMEVNDALANIQTQTTAPAALELVGVELHDLVE